MSSHVLQNAPISTPLNSPSRLTDTDPMASTAKTILLKFGELIPGFHFNKRAMANDEFKPTDVFDHRYQNPKVLTEYLTKTLHFKLEQIKMRASCLPFIQILNPIIQI